MPAFTDSGILKLNTASARKALDRAYRMRGSVFMLGAPGVGKTGLVKAIAAQHNKACVVLSGSAYASTDLQGLPFINNSSSVDNGEVRWSPPQFASAVRDGILFLDEITSAGPNVQAVMLRLVLERRLDTFDLGDAWVIGAGNTGAQAAGYGELTAPMINRVSLFEFEPTLAEVVNGFRFGWGDGRTPFSWMETEEDFAAVGMIATVIERTGLVIASSDLIESGGPYHSPRSWEQAAHELAYIPLSDVTELENMLTYRVGRTAAAQALAVLGGDVLPYPSEVLANPHVVDSLPRLDQRTAAISGGLSQGMFRDDIDGIVRIATWLEEQPESDVAMSILRGFPAFYRQRIDSDPGALDVWTEVFTRLSSIPTPRLDRFRSLVTEEPTTSNSSSTVEVA